MNPKISIVVPIYGVEKYLEKCIDSLLDQTIDNIEIVLVDDGSPDNSGKIADDYALKYSNIKVIHQQNAGLGPARNSGIKASTGEFIGFIDSDDWAQQTMFEKLYKAAKDNKADIVVSGHCDWTNGSVVKTRRHPLAGTTIRDKESIDAVRKNLYGHMIDDSEVEAFPMSVWIAIYKRKMIEEYGLQFENVLSEDIIFNIAAYKCADVITFTDGVDYCYRKEDQTSITQSFSESKLKKYEEFLSTLMESAVKELDESCILRVRRKAIDCCRLYAGQVGSANISFQKKKYYLGIFAKSEFIRSLWGNYPIKYLPFRQRIFQKAILSENYGFALCLNSIRQNIKKIIRK